MNYSDRISGVTRTFELTSDELIVRGKRFLGTGFEQRFPLNELSPAYDKLWARDDGLRVGWTLFVTLATLWPLVYLKFFIKSIHDMHLGLMWAPPVAIGVVFAIVHYGRRPVEYAQLRWRGGPAAVAIARKGKDCTQFDTFVRLVEEAIHHRAAPN